MYNKVKMTIKQIGPKEAQTLLDGHRNYRKLNRNRMAAYARVMNAEQWGLSILLFDEAGQLMDGQTRLNAVIHCGKAQWFACVYNWPNVEIVNIDGGGMRTKAQVGAGERDVTNANIIMAMVTAAEGRINQIPLVLNSEAIVCYDRYGQLAEELYGITRGNRTFRSAVHLIPFLRAVLKFPDRKQEIKDALRALIETRFTEPRHDGLRLYTQFALSRAHNGGGKTSRTDTYLRCARAIKAYLENQPLDKLYRCSSDPFDISEDGDSRV